LCSIQIVISSAGKYTVPILFCKKTNQIINNESSEIVRLLNSISLVTLDLYPQHLRYIIDSTNEWIYHQLNNGVYRCGFAQSQEAYDEAIIDVTAALERIELILSSQW
jgi:putative glutathione S-transferase